MAATSCELAHLRPPRPAGVIAMVLVVAAIGGCGDGRQSVPTFSPTTSAKHSTPLGASVTTGGNRARQTAWAVVRGLQRAGFAVPNPLETTAQECPAAGCAQSVVTDTLRIKSFATPSLARQYASARGLEHAGTIVVSFGPPVSSADRQSYWTEIVRLVT